MEIRLNTGHRGPLSENDQDYKGCKWNILVEWETGEVTYEPLHLIAIDDPVTCAVYAKNNGLHNTTGLKIFKSIAKKKSKLIIQFKQTMLAQVRRRNKFKYGFRFPNTYMEA